MHQICRLKHLPEKLVAHVTELIKQGLAEESKESDDDELAFMQFMDIKNKQGLTAFSLAKNSKSNFIHLLKTQKLLK